MGAKTDERLSASRKVLLILAGLVAGYFLAQVLFNIYDLARPPEHYIYWVVEDAGRTQFFDPVLGRRLTGIPQREALISFGRVTFLGAVRGNSQGLQTRFDFGPERTSRTAKRIAIFGDSYTAGAGMEWNWPDRIQQAAIAGGEPLEILNFSLDGWGLANWAQVLTRMIEPQNYQLDALVFAVWRGDLYRRFLFMDQVGFDHGAEAWAESWDPEKYPRTAAEARPLLRISPLVYILPHERFEQALRGEWAPPVHRRFRWDLYLRVAGRLSPYVPRPEKAAAKPAAAEAQREQRIQDIRRYVEARHIPAMVVYLPSARTAGGTQDPVMLLEQLKLFAKEIGAKFVDGREAFAGLTPRQVSAEWRTIDPHWDQAGSDRFAEFMHKVLRDWVASAEFAPRDSKSPPLHR